MLNQTYVRERVTHEVRSLLSEAFLEPTELHNDDNLVHLGFNSLLLARLVVVLEQSLDVDPFRSGQAKIVDMHTIGDVIRIYSGPNLA